MSSLSSIAVSRGQFIQSAGGAQIGCEPLESSSLRLNSDAPRVFEPHQKLRKPEVATMLGWEDADCFASCEHHGSHPSRVTVSPGNGSLHLAKHVGEQTLDPQSLLPFIRRHIRIFAILQE